MKKLLLTVCTAALFSIAAIAQEQDTTQNQSSEQYRNTPQDETRPAEQAIDSASTEMQEGVNEAEQETEQAVDSASSDVQKGINQTEQKAEEAGENIRQESQNLRNDAQQTGEDIEQNAEEATEDVKQGAEQTGEKIEQGAERTGDQIQQGAERTGDEIEQRTDEATKSTEQDPNSTTQGAQNSDGQMTNASDGNNQPAGDSQLEVVEGKEGPNNEVVYKYQGEMFYVDRNNQKIVKAKEADLQESKHEVIVKDPMNQNADQPTADQNRTKDNQ